MGGARLLARGSDPHQSPSTSEMRDPLGTDFSVCYRDHYPFLPDYARLCTTVSQKHFRYWTLP